MASDLVTSWLLQSLGFGSLARRPRDDGALVTVGDVANVVTDRVVYFPLTPEISSLTNGCNRHNRFDVNPSRLSWNVILLLSGYNT
ncbi:hypothetical protein F5I97DRAFT_1429864 [Phlebopus sp. FC_14]|nr:hypothetical protein F5I97DRAFT_1429864 [Phlebopus sp. FC_14]